MAATRCRQQKMRLGCPHSGNQSDAVQQAVERGQAVGTQLGNKIPLAAGCVDRRDVRKPAQRIDDPILGAALNLDQRDAADGRGDHIRLQHDGIADHFATLLKPLHPRPNGRARCLQGKGEIGDTAPAIMAEQSHKPLIKIVHDVPKR